MARDWIERRNADLASQARVFSQTIAADPSAWGVNPLDATALVAEYEAFVAAYKAAWEPLTRTAAAVIRRDGAREKLAQRMRQLGAIIRANPAVTSEMRINAMMNTVAQPVKPPQGRPQTRPRVDVVSLDNDMLTLRVRDDSSSRAGRPRGYTGAQIFICSDGDPRAANPSGTWRFLAVTTRNKPRVKLPCLAPGTCVSIAARWYNTRGAGQMSNVTQVWTGRMICVPSLQRAA
jgi:hypothetical protein